MAKKEVNISKKKTTKKKVVKKKAGKKNNNSKVDITFKRKILGEAPEEYHFILRDGKKLKNVFELVQALDYMNDNIFKSHVNKKNNDFANWIENIFEEPEFAKELNKIKSKIETKKKLAKELIKELRKIVGV